MRGVENYQGARKVRITQLNWQAGDRPQFLWTNLWKNVSTAPCKAAFLCHLPSSLPTLFPSFFFGSIFRYLLKCILFFFFHLIYTKATFFSCTLSSLSVLLSFSLLSFGTRKGNSHVLSHFTPLSERIGCRPREWKHFGNNLPTCFIVANMWLATCFLYPVYHFFFSLTRSFFVRNYNFIYLTFFFFLQPCSCFTFNLVCVLSGEANCIWKVCHILE